MEDILYTVPEVAKLLKTNASYVHKLRKSGVLRFMKLGQYKIRRETLLRFVESCEGKDATDPFNIKDLEGDEEDEE